VPLIKGTYLKRYHNLGGEWRNVTIRNLGVYETFGGSSGRAAPRTAVWVHLISVMYRAAPNVGYSAE